jgi:hypothetical protein
MKEWSGYWLMNFPYSRVTIFAGPLHDLNLIPKMLLPKAVEEDNSEGLLYFPNLKGVWHEIFVFRFFSWNRFPRPPVINLYFWISPKIFVKFRNGSNGILRGPGETDEKKPEVENLTSDSL